MGRRDTTMNISYAAAAAAAAARSAQL